jgi:hypothetical protein
MPTFVILGETGIIVFLHQFSVFVKDLKSSVNRLLCVLQYSARITIHRICYSEIVVALDTTLCYTTLCQLRFYNWSICAVICTFYRTFVEW